MVIKVTGDDPQYFHAISCKSCAAKLEYTLSDLHKVVRKDYTGGSSGREWLTCPRCTKEVLVNSW